MHAAPLSLVTFAAASLAAAVSFASPFDDPVWIWTRSEAEENERAQFKKTFDVEGEVSAATLWGSCDNVMSVYLNDELVAEANEWSQPVDSTWPSSCARGATRSS